MTSKERRFVSRAGEKLDFALAHFDIDVRELVCADLGSNVGGFVDCLLGRGAGKVYSIDTSYGTLAWKLRKDARVVVLERTNAMHATLPELVDLVTIDVGWTRQEKILPAAARMLKPGGRVVTLIKPNYEVYSETDFDFKRVAVGVPDWAFEGVVSALLAEIRADWELVAAAESPIRGQSGNREMLALLRPW